MVPAVTNHAKKSSSSEVVCGLWRFCSPCFPSLESVGGVQGQKSTFTADKVSRFPLATTYPRDDKLSTKVLHFSLDFAADVELVAVESNALEVGQQVLLAGRVWALVEQEVHH